MRIAFVARNETAMPEMVSSLGARVPRGRVRRHSIMSAGYSLMSGCADEAECLTVTDALRRYPKTLGPLIT